MKNLGHLLFPGQLKLKVVLAIQTRVTPWTIVGISGKSRLRKFKEGHPEIAARKACDGSFGTFGTFSSLLHPH
jgi:hypothetical protein